MGLHQSIQSLDRMDQMIRIKATGTPHAFAELLGFSLATLYRYIDLMKELGASICYCKRRQTFYYEKPGCFRVGFEQREYE